MNTTNLGTANGSAGAAGAVVVIVVWFLSLFHVIVPNEVTVALTTLAIIGTHSTVVTMLFKDDPPPPVVVPEKAAVVEPVTFVPPAVPR